MLDTAEMMLDRMNALPRAVPERAQRGVDEGPGRLTELLVQLDPHAPLKAELIVAFQSAFYNEDANSLMPRKMLEEATLAQLQTSCMWSDEPMHVANALGGVINAASCNVPLFLVAGRTPITEGELRAGKSQNIHWRQESRDQGSVVREFVKWD